MRRLQGLRLRPEREAEIIEELSQHLDDCVRDLMAGGVEEARAREAALADLDTPGTLEHRLAEVERRQPVPLPPPGAPRRRSGWLQGLWQDLRYAGRALRGSPGFTATVVLALAFTIGPATAMLSIGNWLLWRPAPGVGNPDRLGVVWVGDWMGNDGVSPRGLSYANLADLRGWAQSFSGLAGEQEGAASIAIAGRPPEFAAVAWVTANYFTVLDARIAAGRGLLPEDDRLPYGSPVVVISDQLARRAFGSPQAALGTELLVNDRPMSVVGVAGQGFVGLTPFSRVDVWYPGAAYAYVNRFPEQFAERYRSRTNGLFYSFVARLAPGSTFEQAQAELDILIPRLAQEYPDENDGFRSAGARLFPGLGARPLMRNGFQRLVAGLLVVGAVLVLLGCINAASLLLVRGVQRHRDRAVRLSRGATRGRLMQSQLVESCLLALAGAAAGVLLAFWLKQVVHGLMFPEAAAIVPVDVPIDARILTATVTLAALCGLAAGLIPAWIGASPRLFRVLTHTGGRTTRAAARLRIAFASAQLALSLMLLTGALLMVQTVRDIRALDLGFDPAGVSVHRLPLDAHGYAAESALSYHRQLLPALAGTPGIDLVSLSEGNPFGSSSALRVRRRGDQDDPIRILFNEVTPDYFGLLRIPILQGRGFSYEEAMAAGGGDGSVPVIVTESLGRRLFAEASPVGQHLEAPGTSLRGRDVIVIGVARDAHWTGIIGAPDPLMYFPFGASNFGGVLRPVLMVRSARPAAEVRQKVEAVVAALDPAMPAVYGGPLAASIDGDADIANRRVFAWSLSALGAVGFLLAAFGLASLLAQIVSERTREFGVRLAVGARPTQLYLLVLRQASWIAGIGAAAGLVLAWFGSRLLESQLYNVSRFDPLTYASAAVALLLVAFLASLWPGRAATRVNPVDALRAE